MNTITWLKYQAVNLPEEKAIKVGNEFFSGWMMIPTEDTINESHEMTDKEVWEGTIKSLPFIKFLIKDGYELGAVSCIDVKTMKKLDYELQKLGKFETFDECLNAVSDILDNMKSKF